MVKSSESESRSRIIFHRPPRKICHSERSPRSGESLFGCGLDINVSFRAKQGICFFCGVETSLVEIYTGPDRT
jgi:hypothetical protein